MKEYHITEDFKSDWEKNILNWYVENKRDLPWRKKENQNFYRIWISEVMLQQTQVETARPYYHRWLKRFPNTQAVANASEDEVLKLWEGLGYYARARNFKSACEWIQNENNGKIPISVSVFFPISILSIFSILGIMNVNEK